MVYIVGISKEKMPIEIILMNLSCISVLMFETRADNIVSPIMK